jgi:hypothetical protein
LRPAFQKVLNNTKDLDTRVVALLATLNALIVTNSDDDTAIASAYQAVIDHIADVSAAHALSSISYAGNAAAGLPASDGEAAVDAIASRVFALETTSPSARYYEGYIGKNFANSLDPFVGADVGAARNLFWYPVIVPAGKSLVIKRVIASGVGNSDRTTDVRVVAANARVIGGGAIGSNTTFTKNGLTNGLKDFDVSPNHTVYSNPTVNDVLIELICDFIVVPSGGGGAIGSNAPGGFIEVKTQIE